MGKIDQEECPSRATAMKRERQLKSGGGRRFIVADEPERPVGAEER
jgi:hypothetical protein